MGPMESTLGTTGARLKTSSWESGGQKQRRRPAGGALRSRQTEPTQAHADLSGCTTGGRGNRGQSPELETTRVAGFTGRCRTRGPLARGASSNRDPWGFHAVVTCAITHWHARQQTGRQAGGVGTPTITTAGGASLHLQVRPKGRKQHGDGCRTWRRPPVVSDGGGWGARTPLPSPPDPSTPAPDWLQRSAPERCAAVGCRGMHASVQTNVFLGRQ